MNSVDKLLVHHAVLGFLFLFFWWIRRGMELIQFLLCHWLVTFQVGSWVSASFLVRDGIIIPVLWISQLYRSHRADIHRVSHRIMAVKPFEIQEIYFLINLKVGFGLWSTVPPSMKVLVAQSCPTLATPCTVAHQAPMSMEFPRQEYHSGLPLPSPEENIM